MNSTCKTISASNSQYSVGRLTICSGHLKSSSNKIHTFLIIGICFQKTVRKLSSWNNVLGKLEFSYGTFSIAYFE